MDAAKYVIPVHSSYQPEEVLSRLLSDGAFPEHYTASVRRAQATTGPVAEVRVGNRFVFAFSGLRPRTRQRSVLCCLWEFSIRAGFGRLCSLHVCGTHQANRLSVGVQYRRMCRPRLRRSSGSLVVPDRDTCIPRKHVCDVPPQTTHLDGCRHFHLVRWRSPGRVCSNGCSAEIPVPSDLLEGVVQLLLCAPVQFPAAVFGLQGGTQQH